MDSQSLQVKTLNPAYWLSLEDHGSLSDGEANRSLTDGVGMRLWQGPAAPKERPIAESGVRALAKTIGGLGSARDQSRWSVAPGKVEAAPSRAPPYRWKVEAGPEPRIPVLFLVAKAPRAQ